MKKTLLILCCVTLLISGSLFAQGSSEKDASKGDQSITVIMPRHEMDLVGMWEAQTKKFEEETGIKVEFIQMSWDEVQTKVMTDMAAGGKSYDVIEFDNGWIAKFSAADWLEPLNSYGTDEYFNSIVPGLLNTFTVGDDILGVPWNNDTRFFFYNEEMLNKAGITEAPKTWADVLADSKTLQEKNISKYPVAEYWNQEWALANSIAFYLYSFDTNYFDEKGNITINKPQAIKALTLMNDMLNKYKVADPSSITLSQEAAADLFYRGSSAFFFQGPPSTFNYSNDETKSNVVGKVKVAEFLPAETTNFTTLTLPEAFAIPKGSDNKDLAWKYISYMISVKNDTERAKTLGSLPLFSEEYQSDELLALYPYWKEFGKQSAHSKALPLVSWYDELVQKAIVSVQQMLIGSKTPEQTANEIADFLKGKDYNGLTLQ
ncbi:MAG: ABC transporter substrate-binding protein [Pleomorphochaeta sp.]